MKKLYPKRYTLKPHRGFSLVELMVTITIFIMLTSVMLSNYPKFSNKLSIDLLGQDIALSFRQAQIAGSSVLGVSGGNSSRSFGAYGVHLERPNYPAGVANKYVYLLFADIFPTSAGNRQYDGPYTDDQNLTCGTPRLDDSQVQGGINECLQQFIVTGANKIKYLCANFIDNTLPAGTDRVANCGNHEDNQLSWLDVVFVRPNLDAKIFAKSLAGDTVSGLSNVGIVLESPGGDYHKTIVVWKTGQISVE